MTAGSQKPSQVAEGMAKTTFKYGRSKLSPLFSTATDIAMRSDYTGRPLPFSSQEGTERSPRYTWPEYLLTQQTPIATGEAFRDVFNTLREQGMSETSAKSLLTALAKSVPVGAVAATGIRVSPAYRPSPEMQRKEDRKARKASLIDQVRSGKVTSDDLKSLVDNETITEADKSAIEKQGALSPSQAQFANIQYPSQALDRYERMTPSQRDDVEDLMTKKAKSLVNSKSLTPTERDKFRERLEKVGIYPK
jgi:hypothetical protein